MREDLDYYMAKERVERIKGFYGHLVSYIVINLALYVINLVTYPNDFWFDYWFYWQLLIWGIGLVFHAIIVFYSFSFFGKEWEEKKVKQFMQEDYKNNKFE